MPVEDSEERRGNVKGRADPEKVSLRRKASSKRDLATAICEKEPQCIQHP